jgi:hypothetical protein
MKNEKTDELDANQSLFNFASGRRHHRFPKTTPFAEISKGIVPYSPRLPRFFGATLGSTSGNGNNANGVVAEVTGPQARNDRNRVAVGNGSDDDPGWLVPRNLGL